MSWDVMKRMWRHCNVKQCHGTHPYGAPFVSEIHGSGSWMDVSDGPLTWMEFWNKWHGFLPGADCFRSQPWEQPVRDSRYGSRESVEGEAGVDCGWIKESKDRRKASMAEQHIPVAKPIWNKFQGRSETSWFFVYILTELYAMQYIPRNVYNSRFVMLVWHAHLPVLLHWHRGDCPGIILGMVRGGVTMWRLLSLAEPRPRMIPVVPVAVKKPCEECGCMDLLWYSHNKTQHNITVEYMYFTGCILPGRCTYHWLPLMKPNGLTAQKADNRFFVIFK